MRVSDTHPRIPAVVLVTGPPGSGKTTVAEGLRERLGLPLLAKDAIKETLATSLGVTGRDASQELGAAVFELLGELVRELAAAGVSHIVEGNFRARTDIFAGVEARFTQVHVTAEPDVIQERLRTRGPRHPVHWDREAADEVATAAEAGDWPPLDLPGPVLSVDTSAGWPDLDELAARLR